MTNRDRESEVVRKVASSFVNWKDHYDVVASAAVRETLRAQWEFINATYGKAEYLPHDVAKAFAKHLSISLSPQEEKK